MLSRLLKKPLQAGPAYAKKSLFGGEHRAFYMRLRQALPNCLIFPEIALSALITPTATEARSLRQQQEQIDGRTVAYAIYDQALELLCVIELSGTAGNAHHTTSTQDLLQEAGIKRFCWDTDSLPTSEQILRAMAAYTDIAPPKFEAAPNSVLRFPTGAVPEKPAPSRRQPLASSLTVEELQALTPQGSVKATYPHIWERICLFCTDPRHLEQYLSSLSLQDRGGKRSGFPQEVIAEIATLQGANSRFIPTQTQVRASWNDTFFNR
jgi:hypothetical protein